MDLGAPQRLLLRPCEQDSALAPLRNSADGRAGKCLDVRDGG